MSQRLSAEGDVAIGCSASGNTSGVFANHVSIRAVEVGSITTTEIGGALP